MFISQYINAKFGKNSVIIAPTDDKVQFSMHPSEEYVITQSVHMLNSNLITKKLYASDVVKIRDFLNEWLDQ